MLLPAQNEHHMTKYFCDICGKEIKGVNKEIRVIAWGLLAHKSYCRSCFQAEKNWKVIHSLKVTVA
jgi:hypothetical protein